MLFFNFWLLPPGDLLDNTPGGYTADEARAVLGEYGEEDLARYRNFLLVDYTYALVYAAVVLLLIGALWRRILPNRSWPVWGAIALAVAGLLLDFAENTLMLVALRNLDSDVLGGGGGITATKIVIVNVAMFVFLGSALAAVAVTIARRASGKAP